MPNDSLRRRYLLGIVPATATGRAGFNVRDHGAAGDGAHLDTQAVAA